LVSQLERGKVSAERALADSLIFAKRLLKYFDHVLFLPDLVKLEDVARWLRFGICFIKGAKFLIFYLDKESDFVTFIVTLEGTND
jgi:hypothetical protein